MQSEDRAIQNPYDLIVIGASLGGLKTLQAIVKMLKKEFTIPVAVVIHRKHEESSELVNLLQNFTKQTVVEPEDKMKIEPGSIYIAPMGYHLLVDDDLFLLSIDAPVHYARPSIDVLFDSAAFSKKEKLVGILLSGSGADGVMGLTEVKKSGGHTIVQDPKTAETEILLQAALDRMTPDAVLSPNEMAFYLNSLCEYGDE